MRVPPVELDELDEENADAIRRNGDLRVFRVIGNAPTVLRPWMGLGHRLLVATEVGPRLRELVIVHVAVLCKSDYELGQHTPLALAAGATEAEVAAVVAGDVHRLRSGDAGALRLVTSLVERTPVDDADFAATQALLGTRGVVELLMLAGYYLGLAGVLNVLDVELDESARIAVPASRVPASSGATTEAGR